MLQKAQFTQLPNQIFLVENKSVLVKLTINAKDIRNSDKLRMKSSKQVMIQQASTNIAGSSEPILMYRQYQEQGGVAHVVRLHEGNLLIVNMVEDGQCLGFKRLQMSIDQMVEAPDFDFATFPVVFCENSKNQIELVDLRDRGWIGSVKYGSESGNVPWVQEFGNGVMIKTDEAGEADRDQMDLNIKFVKKGLKLLARISKV